jgi:uncharacterized protein with PIN domain
MKRSRAELEATMLAEAKEIIDELLEWHEKTKAPTLTEIEDTVLELRKRMGERMTKMVIDKQEAVRPVPGPACPECGREMHYKDMKKTTIEARSGEVALERAYYYCKGCRGGLFPPGSAIESEDEALE